MLFDAKSFERSFGVFGCYWQSKPSTQTVIERLHLHGKLSSNQFPLREWAIAQSTECINDEIVVVKFELSLDPSPLYHTYKHTTSVSATEVMHPQRTIYTYDGQTEPCITVVYYKYTIAYYCTRTPRNLRSAVANIFVFDG